MRYTEMLLAISVARRVFCKRYAHKVPIENVTSTKKPARAKGESGDNIFMYADSTIIPVSPANRSNGLRVLDW